MSVEIASLRYIVRIIRIIYISILLAKLCGCKNCDTHVRGICAWCLTRKATVSPTGLFEAEILSRLDFPTNRTPVSKMMGFALSSPVENPIYWPPSPHLADNCIQQGLVSRRYICAVLYVDRETETFLTAFWLLAL